MWIGRQWLSPIGGRNFCRHWLLWISWVTSWLDFSTEGTSIPAPEFQASMLWHWQITPEVGRGGTSCFLASRPCPPPLPAEVRRLPSAKGSLGKMGEGGWPLLPAPAHPSHLPQPRPKLRGVFLTGQASSSPEHSCPLASNAQSGSSVHPALSVRLLCVRHCPRAAVINKTRQNAHPGGAASRLPEGWHLLSLA